MPVCFFVKTIITPAVPNKVIDSRPQAALPSAASSAATGRESHYPRPKVDNILWVLLGHGRLPSPAVSHFAEIRKINTAAQWLMEPRSTKMCQMPWKYGRLSWAKK